LQNDKKRKFLLEYILNPELKFSLKINQSKGICHFTANFGEKLFVVSLFSC